MHIIERSGIPEEAIGDCSAIGKVDEAVAYWVSKLGFKVPKRAARAHCKATGAWHGKELADHEDNVQRVFWIACCDFNEDKALPCVFVGD